MSTEIKFEETVSYLLAKVSTAFRNSIERHMADIGLHGGQIFVLIELWKADGLRQVDIAKRLDIAAPTVNKMIKGLMDMEYPLVTLEQADGDGRSTLVFLTEDGADIRTRVEAQWLELEDNSLAGLTETERMILLDLLSKLRNTYTGREAEPD
ncbi:MarR family transcriptional regulator [soil metagenome]